jgi:ubiquitin-protein ligase
MLYYQMASQSAQASKPNQAGRYRRLVTDYVNARRDGPQCGIDIRLIKPDDYEHYYILYTPLSGVYKGQKYIIQIDTTWEREQYPICRPKVRFVTPCWHVNVGSNGGICVSFLNEAQLWTPAYTFKSIMQSIGWLFDEPNPASPMNSEAGRLWVECTAAYKNGRPESLPAADAERLYAECYKPYTNRAAQTCHVIGDYKKWFPQLDQQYYVENITAISIEESEFKELADQILKKKEKPATAEPAAQAAAQDAPAGPAAQPATATTQDAPAEPAKPAAPTRWAKYQTKK